MVNLSVEDGVHVLGRLDDEVKHLLLILGEVLYVGGDGDGGILRDFDAKGIQGVIVEDLALKADLNNLLQHSV